jgi:hypothetical protein
VAIAAKLGILTESANTCPAFTTTYSWDAKMASEVNAESNGRLTLATIATS